MGCVAAKVLAVRVRPAALPAVAPAMQKKRAPVTALANGEATEAVNVIPRVIARMVLALPENRALILAHGIVHPAFAIVNARTIVPRVLVPAVKRKLNTPEWAVLIKSALATDAIGVLGQRNAIVRAIIQKAVLPAIPGPVINIPGTTAPAFVTIN